MTLARARPCVAFLLALLCGACDVGQPQAGVLVLAVPTPVGSLDPAEHVSGIAGYLARRMLLDPFVGAETVGSPRQGVLRNPVPYPGLSRYRFQVRDDLVSGIGVNLDASAVAEVLKGRVAKAGVAGLTDPFGLSLIRYVRPVSANGLEIEFRRPIAPTELEWVLGIAMALRTEAGAWVGTTRWRMLPVVGTSTVARMVSTDGQTVVLVSSTSLDMLPALKASAATDGWLDRVPENSADTMLRQVPLAVGLQIFGVLNPMHPGLHEASTRRALAECVSGSETDPAPLMRLRQYSVTVLLGGSEGERSAGLRVRERLRTCQIAADTLSREGGGPDITHASIGLEVLSYLGTDAEIAESLLILLANLGWKEARSWRSRAGQAETVEERNGALLQGARAAQDAGEVIDLGRERYELTLRCPDANCPLASVVAEYLRR